MSRKQEDSLMVRLMDHYVKGSQNTEIRRTRKPGGWNDIINAYMGKLPPNWPYISVFTDPVVRTTILEKTARLLNSKLRGRLSPREGGDAISAKINNAILEFQWDFANEGGSMIEKIAKSDQMCRLFGAAFVEVYWDRKKNSNEIKLIDPRDLWWDFAATHARNAKWVQIREFTTPNSLEDQGYDVKKLRSIVRKGGSDLKSSAYESQVLVNRGIQDMVGEDLDNPTIEVVREITPTKCVIFAPKHGVIIKDGDNPYRHGKINVAQLRYYPLPDDIYGESEVEPVLPLQKVINAALCAFFDEMNLAMRPPVKIVTGQAKLETIEYGPGARWILNNPNAVTEAQLGTNAVAAFSTVYPALKSAFNTAMGDQSQAISNARPFNKGGDKTATEVISLEKQQNNRDQYNQLYLAEFLKEIMLMWLSNNQQYLFDDPTKAYQIIKIVGKNNIRDFQQMKLDEMDVPSESMAQIGQAMAENPNISDTELKGMVDQITVPTNPVITNPDEMNPGNYSVKKKLDVKDGGQEADLYVTPDDMEGVYDYIPDVASMAVGAGTMQQAARQKAYDMILNNPKVLGLLQTQGEMVKIKELLINILEDAGERDAEGLFETLKPNGSTTGQPTANPIAGGPGAPQPGFPPIGPGAVQGIPTVPEAIPAEPSAGGIPPTLGI